jgi:tryptophanyl-tRNA synthetase
MGLQRKYGGKPQVDVAFQWLYFLFEQNDGRINEIQQEYESGRLLSGELKEILAEHVNAFLEEHRAKREKAKGLVGLFKSTGKLASQMKETIHE